MMRGEHSGPDVVGPAEACKILGVNKRRLNAIRHQATHADTFPQPTELEMGPVWDRAEIKAWAYDRSGRRLTVLRAYRATGSTTEAAQAVGCDSSTARRWLKSLGAYRG